MDEFCLHDTARLIQYAESSVRLLMTIDNGDVTRLHGALFGIACTLGLALRQLGAVPETWMSTSLPLNPALVPLPTEMRQNPSPDSGRFNGPSGDMV